MIIRFKLWQYAIEKFINVCILHPLFLFIISLFIILFSFVVDNICDIYEKAVLKDPQNEELNTHLFMSYVRISDFKKQQQVALNLYKLKPKNPYYFWGVMSILMQVTIYPSWTFLFRFKNKGWVELIVKSKALHDRHELCVNDLHFMSVYVSWHFSASGLITNWQKVTCEKFYSILHASKLCICIAILGFKNWKLFSEWINKFFN